MIIGFLVQLHVVSNNLMLLIDKFIFILFVIIFGYKLIAEIKKPLISLIPQYIFNSTPLFEIVPQIEHEVLNILKNLKIKKDVQFFVYESEEVNAFAISNLKNGIVMVYSGLLKEANISNKELISIIGHELAHIKYWSIHLINYRLKLTYEEIYRRVYKINRSIDGKRIYKWLSINELIVVFELITAMFLQVIYIISNTYSSLVNEVVADKLSVDTTQNSYLADFLERSDNQKVVNYDLYSSDHLPSFVRCFLIRRYYEWKYAQPNFRIKYILLITSSIIGVITLSLAIILINIYLPLLLEYLFCLVKQLWFYLFHINGQVSVIILFNILIAAGVIWSTVKFGRSFINKSSLVEQLENLHNMSFFLFIASLNCVIFPTVLNHYVFKILPILFLSIFIITYSLFKVLDKRK